MIENIATASPVEIDTRLAELYRERRTAQARAAQYLDALRSTLGDRGRYVGGQKVYSMGAQEAIDKAEALVAERGFRWSTVEDYLATLRTNIETAKRCTKEAEPLEARYREERWTRAYLVNNSNGHVHSSRDCSTCFYDRWDDVTGEFKPGTEYVWLPSYSGKDEAEIVGDAGERACTVCYKSAPTLEAALRRPTQMFTPDEIEKAKAREEREAKKREKAAAQVTVEGFTDYSGRPATKVFKTVRAVTNAIAHDLGNLCWYGTEHSSGPGWVANVENCRKALEAKGVEFDYDAALARARKKAEKDARTGYMGDPNFKAKF